MGDEAGGVGHTVQEDAGGIEVLRSLDLLILEITLSLSLSLSLSHTPASCEDVLGIPVRVDAADAHCVPVGVCMKGDKKGGGKSGCERRRVRVGVNQRKES